MSSASDLTILHILHAARPLNTNSNGRPGTLRRTSLDATKTILSKSDLSQLTPKSLRELLEKKFDCSLKSKKSWIKEQTEAVVRRLQGEL